MFLVPIFDASYFQDFGIRKFRLSYSFARFMLILNSLSIIFHRSLCKFRGNLMSKLGFILYIDLTSLKQQFLISLPKTSK